MRNEIPFYDSWKTDSGKDNEVVMFHCEHCGREIYEGDEVWATNRGFVHNECIDEFLLDLVDARLTYVK